MVEATKDMGRDGDYTLGGNVNINFARDVFGFSLGYYEGDYASINGVSAGGSHFLSDKSGSDLIGARNDLFNGNISHMVTSIMQPGTTTALAQGYAYAYDQLNRLTSMKAYNDYTANAWASGGTYTGAYETHISYDAMGNILTLSRNGQNGNLNMDNMTYQYDWVNNTPADGLRSNKLYHVNDAVTSTYTTDIDDQGTFTPASSVNDINALNNYGYDELGNLIRDDAEEIATVEWTLGGKIKSITRAGGSAKPDLSFKYDAHGKRIEKKEIPVVGNETTTYYVYDGNGILMATYSRHTRDDDNDEYDGEEMFICNSHIIYGSSRVGIDTRGDTLVGTLIAPIPSDEHIRILGYKQYENSNHLGNILATITDIKIPQDYNTDFVVDYYLADIENANDYYAFGSLMPGRNWNNEEYRFGFNGMEKDDEVKGVGNSLDFGARIYDSRLGKWLSRDIYANDYVPISSYVFSLDNPIYFTDKDGNLVYGTDGEPIKIDKDDNGNYVITGKPDKATSKLFNAMLKTPLGAQAAIDYTNMDKPVVFREVESIIGDDGAISNDHGLTTPYNKDGVAIKDDTKDKNITSWDVQFTTKDVSETDRMTGWSEEMKLNAIGAHERKHISKREKRGDIEHSEGTSISAEMGSAMQYTLLQNSNDVGALVEEPWIRNYVQVERPFNPGGNFRGDKSTTSKRGFVMDAFKLAIKNMVKTGIITKKEGKDMRKQFNKGIKEKYTFGGEDKGGDDKDDEDSK